MPKHTSNPQLLADPWWEENLAMFGITIISPVFDCPNCASRFMGDLPARLGPMAVLPNPRRVGEFVVAVGKPEVFHIPEEVFS